MNYLSLTSIPLFTGISGEDLALIMDRVELIDTDLAPGEVLVNSGDECQCMTILREGTMLRHCTCRYGTFRNSRKQEVPLHYEVEETVEGPTLLEPEILYGLDLRHRNTWTAQSTCHLTLIGKDDIRQTLMYVPVWRINFLNMLCTQLQRASHEALPHSILSSQGLVTDYLLRHSSLKGTSLTLTLTLEQLAHQLGLGRKLVAETIGKMEGQGLLLRNRNKIIIPSVTKLRNITA